MYYMHVHGKDKVKEYVAALCMINLNVLLSAWLDVWGSYQHCHRTINISSRTNPLHSHLYAS